MGQRSTWRRSDEDSEGDNNQDAPQANGNGRKRRDKDGQNNRIDTYFSRTDGKGTSMRLSYAAEGHPLVLFLSVNQ